MLKFRTRSGRVLARQDLLSLEEMNQVMRTSAYIRGVDFAGNPPLVGDEGTSFYVPRGEIIEWWIQSS